MSEQNKFFDIQEWVPYQLWHLSQDAGYILEDYYSAAYNINGESWRFMAMLASSAPVSAKNLGVRLDMDQVQVTRALNKLLDKGYVNRRTDPRDRRKVILKLSERGDQVYQEIGEIAMALEQKLLSELPDQEREIFTATLSRLLKDVKKMSSG